MGAGKRPLQTTGTVAGGMAVVENPRRKDGMEDFIEELKRKIIDTRE